LYFIDGYDKLNESNQTVSSGYYIALGTKLHNGAFSASILFISNALHTVESAASSAVGGSAAEVSFHPNRERGSILEAFEHMWSYFQL
jgi:hypothetical protein